MISTLRYKRRLLIPFRAKKDIFQAHGRNLKRRLFSERHLFLERRPIKPPFVNLKKHTGHARDPHERKADTFYSAD